VFKGFGLLGCSLCCSFVGAFGSVSSLLFLQGFVFGGILTDSLSSEDPAAAEAVRLFFALPGAMIRIEF
jgi:hypothetical protein